MRSAYNNMWHGYDCHMVLVMYELMVMAVTMRMMMKILGMIVLMIVSIMIVTVMIVPIIIMTMMILSFMIMTMKDDDNLGHVDDNCDHEHPRTTSSL